VPGGGGRDKGHTEEGKSHEELERKETAGGLEFPVEILHTVVEDAEGVDGDAAEEETDFAESSCEIYEAESGGHCGEAVVS
jgi:hypothetical protein